MARMTSEEMRSFLAEPHIAHVVTLRKGGSPHVAPVWYECREGTFIMFTPDNSQKVRNIAFDARASISVASKDEPYRYVVAEGRLGVSNIAFDDVAPRVAARYQGEERGAAFVTELLRDHKMVVLAMTPQRILTYLGD